MTKKITMTIPDAMIKALEKEQEKRKLGSIQDTIRFIISEHFDVTK
jgi:hypothetical protein